MDINNNYKAMIEFYMLDGNTYEEALEIVMRVMIGESVD